MKTQHDGGPCTQPGPRTNLEAALACTSRGWPVFPLHTPSGSGCSCRDPECAHPGKHPRTRHGLLDASADESAICKWWRRWPTANVGIATGVPSGLVVMDIDPRHGGDETLAALEREYGPLPGTVEVCTGGGGRHLYFVHPGGCVKSRTVAPGIDIKADGGYVVAPPSLHASGQRYAWEVASHPDDMPLELPPEWLLAKLVSPPAELETVPAGEGAIISDGKRNASLTSLAGTMRRVGMQPEEIQAALLEVNRRRCRPRLPMDEVSKIARSVGRYAPALALGSGSSPSSSLYRSSDDDDEAAPVSLHTLSPPGPRQWVVGGLIPQNALTVLFGGGGLAKSLLAMLIGDVVARGQDLFGWKVRPGQVLYLDWELDTEEQTRRAYAVAAGLGYSTPPPGLFYRQMERPLEHALPRIMQWQKELGISFTILDSYGLATMGDPTSAKDVIPVLRGMVRSLEACLFIDHIRNLQPGERGDELNPFGSVYKFNIGRSMLRAVRVGGDETSLDLQLRQTKSNFGARSQPVGVRVTFEEERVLFERTVPISSDPTSIGHNSLSSLEKVYRVLTAVEDASLEELAAASGLGVGTVKNQLTELRRQQRADPISRGRWRCRSASSSSPPLYSDDDSDVTSPTPGAPLKENANG